uniref:G protein-coupled receptor n=2 Tax=Panagrellus redivivus TaxID=6233 RepID=A0A7E4VPP1_PANRE
MYRPDYDPLILGPGDWYGITCFVLEIVLSAGVLIQNVLWLYETCFKSANVHSGMKMVFYSIILTSVLMIIGRLIILYGDTYRGSISVQTAMGAKYFHDTASLQFPMNPILMTLERLIATQRFKTYEVAKRPNIVIFMNVASWTYAIWMQFGSAYSLGAQVYMITVYFQFFLQFCTVALYFNALRYWMAPSSQIVMFVFLAVYIGISTSIGYCIDVFVFERLYKDYDDPLITGSGDVYGIGCVTVELLLSFGIIVLNVFWMRETFYGSANVHFGMKMIFHSIVLTSVLTVVGRLIILYAYLLHQTLPLKITMAAKYFHDVASLQFPMNPIIMTIERVFATRRVKTYENEKPLFIFYIVLLAWTISIWLQFLCASFDIFAELVVNIAYVQLFALLCTIISMTILFRLNLKRYKTKLPTSLTERYQTAENIRLLRAVLKFTIINAISGLVLQTFVLLVKLKDYDFAMTVYHYVAGIWNVSPPMASSIKKAQAASQTRTFRGERTLSLVVRLSFALSRVVTIA